MKACEGFLQLVLMAYIIEAASVVRKSLLAAGENPDLSQVAKLVVSLYTDMSPDHTPTHSSDQVQDYAKEILTLGLLWYGFKDAIREGDRDRVMQYWRYFLVLFKACRRKNYSCEAAKVLFSDRPCHLACKSSYGFHVLATYMVDKKATFHWICIASI